MGDEARSKSLPNITDERRSRGIFRPQIIRNISPLDTPGSPISKSGDRKIKPQPGHSHDPFFSAEIVEKSLHSSIERMNIDPIKYGSTSGKVSGATKNGNANSIPTFPPRTSSLNTFSSFNSSPEKCDAWGKVTTVDSNDTPRTTENVAFLDICQGHPGAAGDAFPTSVIVNPDGSKVTRTEKRAVKTPAPRMSRIMGGLRNAFSRSRSEKRLRPGLTFDMVENPIQTSRPIPQTPATSDNGSPKKGSRNRPIGPQILPSHNSEQFRELETTGLDSVRQTLNGIGRLLVEDDDIERRRVWYRVSLHP